MKILLYISVLVLIYTLILYTLLKHQIQKPHKQVIPLLQNIPSPLPSKLYPPKGSQSDHFNNNQPIQIPHHIFTYWNSPSLPPLVSTCISSWKIHNPTYTITIITPENLAEHIAPFNLSEFHLDPQFIARQSDFIRIIVILKNGGIWMDSTMYCNQPLTWLPLASKANNQPTYDLIAYTNPQTSPNHALPIIENWFFAAPKNSPVLQAWLKESIYMKTFATEDEYVNKVQSIKKIQGLNDSLPYLVMHLTLARVCQTNLETNESKPFNIKLYDSLAPDGPFNYLSLVNWDSKKAIENFKNGLASQQKLVKFRGIDREAYY